MLCPAVHASRGSGRLSTRLKFVLHFYHIIISFFLFGGKILLLPQSSLHPFAEIWSICSGADSSLVQHTSTHNLFPFSAGYIVIANSVSSQRCPQDITPWVTLSPLTVLTSEFVSPGDFLPVNNVLTHGTVPLKLGTVICGTSE